MRQDLAVICCGEPAYDEDGTTVIGTCGTSVGPCRGLSQEQVEAEAARLGWQLAPPRCPFHRSGGHLTRPELIIDVDC